MGKERDEANRILRADQKARREAEDALARGVGALPPRPCEACGRDRTVSYSGCKLGQAHGNEEAIRQWREDALGIVLSSKGIKGLRKRERPWKPPASDRSVKRAAAAQAQQDQAAAEAQALEDRRAAFRAIAWPESVTALQSEAYRLHVVEGHSLAETGRLMAEITGKPGGIGRASVQTHVKKAKKSAGMQ
jgi:hypothetical protein